MGLSQDNPTLRDELVAYLDGELDPQQSRRIEELLANNPEVRREVQGLDRTWRLLDELDATPVEEHFTRSTLEMVTVAASADAARQKEEAPRRRRLRWLAAAGSMLVAGLFGFLAVAALAPDPKGEFRRDLPMLEDFDEYRQVRDIEFLRALAREGLFTEEVEDARPECLSPTPREEILRHQEQFQALAPADQQQVRQLHEQIQGDPQSDKLREVMNGYCHWLSTLQLYRRASLQDLEPAKRIELVKQLRKEQARNAGKRLDAKDRQALVRWIEKHAARLGSDFLKSLPESRRQEIAKSGGAASHRTLMLLLWQASHPATLALLTDSDLADLRGQLSPETRKRLEAKSHGEQRRMIGEWLRDAARQQLASRKEGLLPGFDEPLADFFEHGLTDEEQDRLMALPSEEAKQKLRDMYVARLKTPGGRRTDRSRWHSPKVEKPPKDAGDDKKGPRGEKDPRGGKRNPKDVKKAAESGKEKEKKPADSKGP